MVLIMSNPKNVKYVFENLNDSTNKEIISVLDFLNEDFEKTKKQIIDLTKHIEGVEIIYNKILKEYEKRNLGERK